MKKTFLLTALLLAVLLLAGCAAASEPEPTATPVPTAEPTPTPVPTPKMIAFSDGTSLPEEATVIALNGHVSPEELISNMGEFLAPEQIVLAQGYSAQELSAIAAAFPELPLSFSLTVSGIELSDTVTTLDLTNVPLSAYDELLTALPLCVSLTDVNLNNVDGAALPDAAMIRQEGAEAEAAETADAAPATFASALGWEALGKLQQACPDVKFDYRFTYRGGIFSACAETVDLSGISIGTKNVDEVHALAAYLPQCTYLDMDGCSISNEAMANLRDALPQMKVVWRVGFGHSTSARTDATRIRLVKDGTYYKTKELANLKYCTDVELLDIGHNKLKNIDFVAYMPKLRVAILAIGYLEDLTPLMNCTEIEYLELFTNLISDLTPLSGLTSLRHLNLCYNDISDVSALHSLTGLERLWLGRSDLTAEQKDALAAALPNTEINYGRSPTGDGWREHPRYDQLFEEFNYAHPKNGGY